MHITTFPVETKYPGQRVVCAKRLADVYLPPEILEQILAHAWLSFRQPEERGYFAASVSLVSKLWHAVFTRIYVTNIFILSSSGFEHFRKRYLFRHLMRDHPENLSSPSFLRSICRTAARQIIIPPPKRHPGCQRLELLIDLFAQNQRDLLETFRLLPFLPNLHTLSVAYFPEKRTSFSRIVDVATGIEAHVVRLDLEYSLAGDTQPWVVDELGLAGARWDKQRNVPWAVPDLEHISFGCDSDGGIAEFLNVCPHLQLAVEEMFEIRVKITSASRALPQHVIIVHGAMEPSSYAPAADGRCYLARNGCINLASVSSAPLMVRGTALGLVFESPLARPLTPVEHADILDKWRDVRVFMPKGRPR